MGPRDIGDLNLGDLNMPEPCQHLDQIQITHTAKKGCEECHGPGSLHVANGGRYGLFIKVPDADISMFKAFTLHERLNLQFRAEMFNTFNHPNFYAPNGSYGGCDPNADSNCPSGFGQITSAFASREIQFGGKFYW